MSSFKKISKAIFASMLLASIASSSMLSVSAADMINSASEIKNHFIGVVGSFNGWTDDIQLMDKDNDGIYEGLVQIPEVTEDMFINWYVDDVFTGEQYLQFKVRLDEDWTDSWGSYEPIYDRTWNSQSCVPVKEAVVGQPLSFIVRFDTRSVDPAALENPESDAQYGDEPVWYLPVSYEITTEIPEEISYFVSKDGTVSFNKYNGYAKNYTIPSTIEGKPVTEIGGSAFSGCLSLEEVTIPDTVKTIGEFAFSDCQNLKKVKMSKNVKEITRSTFNSCYKLEEIDLPYGLVSIGESAFADNRSLKHITIPKTVKYIGEQAFFGNGYLESIVLPDSVESIGKGAFTYCFCLESVRISNKMTSIPENAFFACVSLKGITIPSSVKSIGDGAFTSCDNMSIGGSKGSYAEKYAAANNIPFFTGYTNVSAISTNEMIIGGKFNVEASAVLGQGDYTYAVLYKKKADTKWTVKQNYSNNTYVEIKPFKATDYDVCVKVKDSKGTIVKKYFTVKVNAKLQNKSTISATSIKKGNTVTVSGVATGGIGNYEYGVLYKNSVDKKWTVKQGYTDNANIKIKPARTGEYQICIKIKDETGTIEKKYFYVTVK